MMHPKLPSILRPVTQSHRNLTPFTCLGKRKKKNSIIYDDYSNNKSYSNNRGTKMDCDIYYYNLWDVISNINIREIPCILLTGSVGPETDPHTFYFNPVKRICGVTTKLAQVYHHHGSLQKLN